MLSTVSPSTLIRHLANHIKPDTLSPNELEHLYGVVHATITDGSQRDEFILADMFALDYLDSQLSRVRRERLLANRRQPAEFGEELF